MCERLHIRAAVAEPINAHARALASVEPVEIEMRMIAVVFSLIVLTVPSYAAQKTWSEKRCRDLVGSEEREGEGGRSHVGQMQVQRFSDCMMGVPY
jgi:hypothetical protein